jgi:prepilin-type N-terminal cleavage/methylation domain-containing protein
MGRTKKMKTIGKQSNKQRSRIRGFSLIELVLAVAVIMILAAFAMPSFSAAMHTAHLKGVVSDYSGLLQSERIKAVDDDRYYSAYIIGNSPSEAFVDIYPQQTNGASGTGGTAVNAGDPLIPINQEISQRAVAAAPSTASLQLLLLPANSPVVPLDGSSTTSPPTFGPRGLPCKPLAGVCDTLGGPQAYWTFFQNSVTQKWGAVTVTPAGRIQRWIYNGATWVSY